MTQEAAQDETASFVATSSDLPEVQAEAQEGAEVAQEEQASSEGETETTEAESSEQSSEQDDNGEDTTAEPEQPKKANGVQKRIDKVVREREQAKRENEALKAKLESLESNKSDNEQKPKESDYDTYDEYLDALGEFDESPPANEGKKEEPSASNDDEIKLSDEQRTALAITQERVNGADKPEDFDKVALDPDLQITGEMLEGLAECDEPAKVMYHLGKNKDLAAEIAQKSPAQQMREIAKLDLTVEVKPPKPTKTTSAPDPISPVGGSDAQEKPVSEMSYAEFEAHRNKQDQKRGSSW